MWSQETYTFTFIAHSHSADKTNHEIDLKGSMTFRQGMRPNKSITYTHTVKTLTKSISALFCY